MIKKMCPSLLYAALPGLPPQAPTVDGHIPGRIAAAGREIRRAAQLLYLWGHESPIKMVLSMTGVSFGTTV